MSDEGATAFPTQSIVTCGACGETIDVSWFCKNCLKSLCSNCQNWHQTDPHYKEHLVVQRSIEVLRLYGPAKIAEPCRIHPTKEISAYCNKCNAPCCITCVVEKHQTHSISTIEEKYLSAEKDLDEYTRELEHTIKPKLDQMQDTVKAHLSSKESMKWVAKEDVNSFRRKLKQAVDDSCDKLLLDLEKSDADLRNLIARLDVEKEKIHILLRDTENKIREGKLDLIEYNPPSLSALIPDIDLPVQKIPCFVPGNDLLGKIEQQSGTVEFKEIEISKVISFSYKITATSLNSAGKMSAWAMYSDTDTMDLFKINGKLIRSVTLKGSEGINDMVSMKSGEMVVTCRDKKIRYVSVLGVVSSMIDMAPFNAEGVCLTHKEEIAVCMRGQGERNNVTVFSPGGLCKLREIRGIDGLGKQQITDPYRIVLKGSDLCVVNWYSNVVCVNEEYGVRWVYDGEQTELESSFYPRGICVDKHHNLLVTDGNNHCVHYIDREGRMIQIILTKEQTGLCCHWVVCVDDETDLVCLGNACEIVVAKYLK